MKRIAYAIQDVYDKVKDEEPARALGAVAAVITAVASILNVADVHTWQAAVPVLLAEGIRRFVFSPYTAEEKRTDAYVSGRQTGHAAGRQAALAEIARKTRNKR